MLDGLSFFTALVWTAGALPTTFVTGRTPVALSLNECHEKSGGSANVLPSAVDAMACSGGAIIALASPHARPQRGPLSNSVGNDIDCLQRCFCHTATEHVFIESLANDI